jgi:hypothetical protein
VHGLCQTYHRLRNCFGCTQWYSYVTRLKWNLISFHLEIVLILTQDRCPVCAEHTIGSESFWINPMELVGDVGRGESCFGLFGDCVSVGA